MTRKEIAKDFLQGCIAGFSCVAALCHVQAGVYQRRRNRLFQVWLACGVPFGIWRLRVWLIPRGFDIGGTVGVWALNIIIGGLIGGVVVVWRLLVAAWYTILTVYRLVTYNSESNRIAREIVATYPISE